MENTVESQPNNNAMYYILGVIVLIAVVAAGYFMRPKTTLPSPVVSQPTAAASPTPGPITRLGCDMQYYNPVLGFTKYFISVEGGDITGPSQVECTTTVTQNNKIVGVEKSTVPLTAKPERGGNVFKCSTSALELIPNIQTTVDVVLKDDQGAKASCSANFALPKT